jgi:hypothetical protein
MPCAIIAEEKVHDSDPPSHRFGAVRDAIASTRDACAPRITDFRIAIISVRINWPVKTNSKERVSSGTLTFSQTNRNVRV